MSFKQIKYRHTPYQATCPICANRDNELLYQITAEEAAAQFLVTQSQKNDPEHLRAVTDCISDIWERGIAAVVNCPACGFSFADPFTSGDAHFYNLITHGGDLSNAGKTINWKWEFDVTYKVIEQLATANPSLTMLEIGASTGDFSRTVAKLIPKENILCLEYATDAVAVINQAGIEASTKDFRELKADPQYTGKFDIICLFQVLEHLDALDETFETFNTLIKSGGHLFIGVPNDKKIVFNELNGALLDLPPNHIGRFNPHTFKLLGQKYDWQINDLKIERYTPLDVMKTVMFSQSIKRTQYPPVERTLWYNIKEYISIKYLRLKAMLMHKQLGEALWVHYQKTA